jgi:hypothetical protein
MRWRGGVTPGSGLFVVRLVLMFGFDRVGLVAAGAR